MFPDSWKGKISTSMVSIAAVALAAASWVTYLAMAEPGHAQATALRICVAAEDSSLTNGAKTTVSRVGERLRESHDRYGALLRADGGGADWSDFAPPAVVTCPEGFVGANLNPSAGRQPVTPERNATSPKHDIRVFVVQDGQLPTGEAFARRPYEMQCFSDDSCAEVSTALYVSQSALTDDSLLLAALENAAGWNLADRDTPLKEQEYQKSLPPKGTP